MCASIVDSYPGGKAFDQDSMLSELSRPLRQSVKLNRCLPVLQTLRIFEKAGENSSLLRAMSLWAHSIA